MTVTELNWREKECIYCHEMKPVCCGFGEDENACGDCCPKRLEHIQDREDKALGRRRCSCCRQVIPQEFLKRV